MDALIEKYHSWQLYTFNEYMTLSEIILGNFMIIRNPQGETTFEFEVKRSWNDRGIIIYILPGILFATFLALYEHGHLKFHPSPSNSLKNGYKSMAKSPYIA